MYNVLATSNKPSLEAIYYEASKEEKEVMFNNLKDEVDKLLIKVQELGKIEVLDSVFGSTDGTRITVFSDGKLFLRERYYDPKQQYVKARIKAVQLEDIPKNHRFTTLRMQKELMEEAINEFRERDSDKSI